VAGARTAAVEQGCGGRAAAVVKEQGWAAGLSFRALEEPRLHGLGGSSPRGHLFRRRRWLLVPVSSSTTTLAELTRLGGGWDGAGGGHGCMGPHATSAFP
jgi:hypothetical protein